jgi:DUF1680 family protein
VKRGPLVYCLESTDLPEDVRLADVRLSRTAKLTTANGAGVTEGLTLLQGAAYCVKSDDFGTSLYRPARPQQRSKVNIKLIPYFAWGNRGESEMTVWIPQAD